FRKDLPVAPRDEQAAYQRAMTEYLELTRPAREAIARLEAPYRQQLYEKRLSRLSDEAQVAHRTAPEKRTAMQKQIVAETTRLLQTTPQKIPRALSEADRAEVKTRQAELQRLESRKPRPLPVTLGLTDRPGPPPRTYLLERGDLGNRAEEVQPGFPVVF